MTFQTEQVTRLGCKSIFFSPFFLSLFLLSIFDRSILKREAAREANPILILYFDF